LSNLRIVPRNWVDEMALTGSEGSAAMPLEFLQDSARGHVWRSETLSTGGGGVREITGTLGSGVVRDANCFFVFRHNLAGGTYRLRLLDASAATVYDSTTLTFDPLINGTYYHGATLGTDPLQRDAPLVIYFPLWEFKSFILTLGGTLDSGDVYAQACRIFLGIYFEVGINPDFGARLSVDTTTNKVRTRGGSLLSLRGEMWKTFEAELNRMSEADRSVWLDIMSYNGLDRDLVLSLFPGDGTREERDYTLWGKFASLEPLGYQVSWRTMKLSVEGC